MGRKPRTWRTDRDIPDRYVEWALRRTQGLMPHAHTAPIPQLLASAYLQGIADGAQASESAAQGDDK